MDHKICNRILENVTRIHVTTIVDLVEFAIKLYKNIWINIANADGIKNYAEVSFFGYHKLKY